MKNEKEMIVIYLTTILKLVKNVDYQEDTTEGLIMHISLLKKVKGVLTDSIARLENSLEQIVERESVN